MFKIGFSRFLRIFAVAFELGLSYGVMVTRQILVLKFQVRILVAQPNRTDFQCGIFLLYNPLYYTIEKPSLLEERMVAQYLGILLRRYADVLQKRALQAVPRDLHDGNGGDARLVGVRRK